MPLTMRKYFTLILLGFSLNISASHLSFSFFEYEVDSTGTQVYIELHVFRDKSGITFDFPSLSLQGPIAVSLNRIDSLIQDHFYPNPTCGPDLAFTEYVYSDTVDLSMLNIDSSGISFAFAPACCIRQTENLINTPSMYLEFSLYPRLSPGASTGPLYPHSTIGLNRPPVFVSYSNTRNYLNMSYRRQPIGVDSVYHELTDPRSSANGNSAFHSGYSGRYPFPDQSEDPRNGKVEFDSLSAHASFAAWKGSFGPGYYAYSKKSQHFLNDTLISLDNNMGGVLLQDIDTNLAPLTMYVDTRDSLFTVDSIPEVLNYSLDLGDTLFVDLKVNGGSPIDIAFLGDSTLIDTNYLAFSPSPNFKLPELVSFNSTGTFQGGDTNHLQLAWIPGNANFALGKANYSFNFTFKYDTCLSPVKGLIVNVHLDPSPRITSNGYSLDSITICGAGAIPVFAINSSDYPQMWSPPQSVQQSDRAQTTIQGNYAGWIYLQGQNGFKIDSLYVQRSAIDSIYSLSENNDSLSFQDQASSIRQDWYISEKISVEGITEDLLPLLGAGTYSVRADFGLNNCAHYSDTLTISESYLWGSNHGVDRYNLAKDSIVIVNGNGQTYDFEMKMPQDHRLIKTLYFYGFQNLNPFVPKTIEVRVLTSYGYQKTYSAIIRNENYIALPVQFDLGPSSDCRVYLSLPNGIEMQMIHSSESIFSRNYIDYQNFRVQNGSNGSHLTSQLRFPLGIAYDGTISQKELAAPQLQIYPNPTEDILHVRLQNFESKLVDYQLMNLQGQVLLKGSFNRESVNSISLTDLPRGLYYLKAGGLSHPILKN